MTKRDNTELQKSVQGITNQDVDDTTISLRCDSDRKKRFRACLGVGRRSTLTDVFKSLMDAYCAAVEATGRQPEPPLELREKRAKK